jgi:hypothetical protein
LVGDVDGDGTDDLVSSSWKADTTDVGRAYLFLGGTSPTSITDAFATFSTTTSSSYAGSVVDGADVDGDGRGDVLVAAYGRTSSSGGVGVWRAGDIGGGALTASNGDTADTGAPAFWNPAISPPYFRLKLDRLYINRFQSIGAAPTRDLALIVNYGLATTRTVANAQGPDAGAPELAAKFAVGGIRLPGARAGDYKDAALTALQSGWMPVPGVKSYDPRATVDVVAYVVEFAPGNPMLEDIGEYLAGPDMRRKVETVITEAGGRGE